MLIQALFKNPLLRIRRLPFYTFSEALSSTFQSKSKLNEFYKYIHPDMLTQAPERVKDENLRSLKTLNAYFDAVNQNKGVGEHRLRFYVAEKETVKNKKYFLFEVRLGLLKPNVPDDFRAKHLEDCTKKLMTNLRDTLTRKGDLFKETINESDTKKQAEGQSKYDTFLYEMGPFDKKKNNLQEAYRKSLQDHAYDSYYKTELRKAMKEKIEDQIEVYEDEKNVKMWTKQLVKDIEENWSHNHATSYSFDVRLIYFEESLNSKEIDIFMSRLKKTTEKIRNGEVQILDEIGRAIESYEPPINLMVGKKYETSIPGFISIPFDFDYKEALTYIIENADEVAAQKMELKQEYATAKKHLEILKNSTEFSSLSISPELVKGTEELKSVNLSLKRLISFFSAASLPKDSKLFSTRVEIVSPEEELRIEGNKLYIPTNFQNYELRLILRSPSFSASTA